MQLHPASLALVAPLLVPGTPLRGSTQEATATGARTWDVAVPELAYSDAQRPGVVRAGSVAGDPERWRLLRPRVVLDPHPGGAAEAWFVPPQTATWNLSDWVLGGHVVARADGEGPIRGTIYLPRTDATGMEAAHFTLPDEACRRDAEGEQDFEAGRAARYEALLAEGLPGAAWFRHRAGDADHAGARTATAPWSDGAVESGELGNTLALLSGGRAAAENLQLDRLIPAPRTEGPEPEVDVDSLEGIDVPEYDWSTRLADEAPAIDPLAAWIPADQHAFFAQGFAGFVALVDELDREGSPLVAAYETASRSADSRARLERQLALPLDAVTRALGPALVRSVAVTGGDLYLRTGTDVAVLLQCPDPAPVIAFVRARQQAALAGTPGARAVEEEGLEGVVSPTRSVSSYLALVDGVVVVANSPVSIARIRAAHSGANLSTAPELAFFRQRYALGAAGESAFVVLPDAAIRRWCGPRWRIAASRRLRALASLLDLQAAHVDALATGKEEGVSLPVDKDREPDLGEVTLTADGVRSSIWGTAEFLTPIVELDVKGVTAEEARLYGLWRDGYQRDWSRFFDPIGARFSIDEHAVDVDVTVLPLILGSEYGDLSEVCGQARLAPGTADPHEGALVQFAMAVDPESEPVRELGGLIAGALSKDAAGIVSWVGGALTVFADEDPVWDTVLEADGIEEALENMSVEWNDLPLAFEIDSRSALKLAGWLTALRTFVEGSAAGLTTWTPHQDEAGNAWVEVRGQGLPGGDEHVLYAALPEALVVSPREETLRSIMERRRARRESRDGAAAEPWPGESAALILSQKGIQVLGALFNDELSLRTRRLCYDNLPILNEWKRLFPDQDPVAVHERLFGEHLTCPAGGTYVWNEEWQTMESTVLGNPAAMRGGAGLPTALTDLEKVALGFTFEADGVRGHLALTR